LFRWIILFDLRMAAQILRAVRYPLIMLIIVLHAAFCGKAVEDGRVQDCLALDFAQALVPLEAPAGTIRVRARHVAVLVDQD
jgi:hypothetical protein